MGKQGIFPKICVREINKCEQQEQQTSPREKRKTSAHGLLENDLLQAKSQLRPTLADSLVVPTLVTVQEDGKKLFDLFSESSFVLRLWGSCVKEKLVAREYDIFWKVQKLLKSIIETRRQLMSQNLAGEDLEQLKTNLHTAIDKGNLLMGLPMMIRSEKTGLIPSISDASLLDVYHSYVNTFVNDVQSSISSITRVDEMIEKPNCHLRMELKAAVATTCMAGESSHLEFSLFDNTRKEFITDPYLVVLTSNGMPRDEEKIGKIRNIFTSIGQQRLDSLYLVCRIYRQGKMIADDGKKSVNSYYNLSKSNHCVLSSKETVKRPFAVAVFSLSEQMGKLLKGESFDCVMNIQSINDALFYSFHETLIESKDASSASYLCINLQLIKSDYLGMSETLAAKECVLTKRANFPTSEAYNLIDKRHMKVSQVSLSLVTGDFHQGHKSQAKNVQVSVQLRMDTGEFVPEVFYTGEDETTREDIFQSSVLYHTNSPHWLDRLRLDVSPEILGKCHLFFTFRHCSSYDSKSKDKTFAFSFLPLMSVEDKLLIANQDFKLSMFKYDDVSSTPAIYLRQNWPPLFQTTSLFGRTEFETISAEASSAAVVINDAESKSETSSMTSEFATTFITLNNNSSPTRLGEKLKAQTLQKMIYSKDNLTVSLFFDSHEYPQNGYLANLLNWEVKKFVQRLTTILKDFMFVSHWDIVRFFPKITTSLFEIIHYAFKITQKRITSDNAIVLDSMSEMQKLAVNALVHTLNVMTVGPFSKASSNLVDDYLMNVFTDTEIGICISRTISYTLSNCEEPESARDLFALLKVWRYLFKFIHKGYDCSIMDEIKPHVQTMLENVNTVMSKSGNTITKTILLSHFIEVPRELDFLFTPLELVKIVVDFVFAVSDVDNKLVNHQLVLFQGLIRLCHIFRDESARDMLVQMICVKLKSFLRLYLDEKISSVVSSSVSIVSYMVKEYQEIMISNGQSCSSIRYLALLLPELLESFILDHDNELAPVVLTIFQLLPNNFRVTLICAESVPEFGVWPLKFAPITADEQMKFVSNIFMFVEALLGDCKFNPQWLVLNVFTLSVLLRILLQIQSLFQKHFTIDNTEQWCRLFLVTLRFLSSQPLHDPMFLKFEPAKEVHSLISKGLELIETLWLHFSLVDVPVFEKIIEPLLVLAAREHKSIRSVCLKIYSLMLEKEYCCNSDFETIIRCTATAMETLFLDGFNIDYIQALKNAKLQVEEKPMQRFIEDMDALMYLLIEMQSIPNEEWFDDESSFAEISLMNFYASIGLTEKYLMHIHTLTTGYLKRQMFLEAGYMILLHANTLSWDRSDSNELFKFQKHINLPQGQSSFDRKVMLYRIAIGHFDKGQGWEEAIRLCRELAQKLEFESYDYQLLAEILEKQAKFYLYIVNKDRYYPEYFRVAYFGLGFPVFFRNKQFIYRGLPFEKLASFVERIQNRHAHAKLLKSNDIPDKSVLESHEQLVQIVSVKIFSEANYAKELALAQVFGHDLPSLLPMPSAPRLRKDRQVMREQRKRSTAMILNSTTEPLSQPIVFEQTIVPEKVLLNTANTKINTFYFDRPFKKKDSMEIINEFSNLFIDRYILRSTIEFPCYCNITLVSSIEKVCKVPMENAYVTVHEKTLELVSLAMKAKNSDSPSTSLTMALNGAIDAAVGGGIQKYQEAFLNTNEFIEAQNVLNDAIHCQIVVMKKCIDIHADVVSEQLRPLHEKMVDMFDKNFSEYLTEE